LLSSLCGSIRQRPSPIYDDFCNDRLQPSSDSHAHRTTRERLAVEGTFDSPNIATQEATVDYLPQNTTLANLNKAVETWGYKPRPATSDAPVDKQEEAHAHEYRKLMKKFWFAAAVSVFVMITAYYQAVPILRDWSMDSLRFLWGVTALLTLPVMFQAVTFSQVHGQRSNIALRI
jgi:cation transport ATPase